MNSELKPKILKLYKNNMSLREIGEKLHISHESVRQAIPKHLIRRKKTISAKDELKVVKMFEQTRSYQETAERLDMGTNGRQKVYSIVSRNRGKI